MKRSPLRTLFYSIFLLVLFSLPFQSSAQCPDAGFDPGCDPVTCLRQDGSYCPIDSNLYILLAAGVVYGIVKIRGKKKVAPEEIDQI